MVSIILVPLHVSLYLGNKSIVNIKMNNSHFFAARYQFVLILKIYGNILQEAP